MAVRQLAFFVPGSHQGRLWCMSCALTVISPMTRSRASGGPGRSRPLETTVGGRSDISALSGGQTSALPPSPPRTGSSAARRVSSRSSPRPAPRPRLPKSAPSPASSRPRSSRCPQPDPSPRLASRGGRTSTAWPYGPGWESADGALPLLRPARACGLPWGAGRRGAALPAPGLRQGRERGPRGQGRRCPARVGAGRRMPFTLPSGRSRTPEACTNQPVAYAGGVSGGPRAAGRCTTRCPWTLRPGRRARSARAQGRPSGRGSPCPGST